MMEPKALVEAGQVSIDARTRTHWPTAVGATKSTCTSGVG